MAKCIWPRGLDSFFPAAASTCCTLEPHSAVYLTYSIIERCTLLSCVKRGTISRDTLEFSLDYWPGSVRTALWKRLSVCTCKIKFLWELRSSGSWKLMGDRGFLPMHDTGVHTTCDLFDIQWRTKMYPTTSRWQKYACISTTNTLYMIQIFAYIV